MNEQEKDKARYKSKDLYIVPERSLDSEYTIKSMMNSEFDSVKSNHL
jgi:hypothetical protein